MRTNEEKVLDKLKYTIEVRRGLSMTVREAHDVADYYNAKYVGDFSIRDKHGNWTEQPVGVFYTEKKHPEGSNYFGIYRDGLGNMYVCDAISATEPFTGIIDKNNHIIYSAYRHDYVVGTDGETFADGGRDYFRGSIGQMVNLHIVDGNVEIMDEKDLQV